MEDWAEIRRLALSERWSIKRICRERGFARNTVRAALRSERPPVYERSASVSKLDPFRMRVEELLAEDGRVPGEVILERLREAGYEGSRTILNDLLREVRPRFAPARTYQRTRYEPGQVYQFDLWHTTRPVPVGCGQVRRGYVVIATLGYSRASAGALVFAREAPDVLWGRALAADHRRSYAKHRTITDARHQATLEAMRTERLGARTRPSDEVERRDLAAYDALIRV